jgi:collagen type VI alpha
MDASSSIWGPDFEKQLNFARELIEEFDADETRLGVVTFSDGAHEEISLGRIKSDAISKIPQHLGGTRTDLALQKAMNMYKHSARGEAHKVVIVLTDGQSELPEATTAAAQQMHDDGITSIAVGIGDSVDAEELSRLASRSDLVFQLKNFDALVSIRGRLVTKACNDEAPGKSSDYVD